MCGIFSWISGCVLATIVGRSMELRWPNSGGCSRRKRASSRCLQRAGAVLFCLSRRSSEVYSRAVDWCYNLALALVAVRRVKEDAG